MKKIYSSLCLIFSFLSNNSSGQIFNGDFEDWDSTYTACYHSELTDTFNVPNPLGGILNRWDGNWCGMCQTTDAYSGSYAMILFNWYVYATSSINFHDSINHRPLFLQGHYKYIKGGYTHQAQGLCEVSLTRTNGILKDTIAVGSFQFDSSNYFAPFQIALNYNSNLIPDSINIFFINADANSGFGGLVSNLLYLDDLTLSNSPLKIENFSSDDMIRVYPNPVSNELNINNNSNQSIRFNLYNSLGEKIISKSIPNKTIVIDLSAYSSGIYFYQIAADKQLIKTGKIIKE